MGKICENIEKLLKELNGKAKLLLATKERSIEEIQEAIKCGARVFGENYLQEAEVKISTIGHIVEWHYIGSIQKKKIKKLVKIFDVIETVDSLETAFIIDKESEKFGKITSVLIEINSGREPQKSGVMPEDALKLSFEITKFNWIRLTGFMTMGPNYSNPEDLRPYFRLTKQIFDTAIAKGFFRTDSPILSMGMSNSYKIALEEGANLVRIGTLVFGERKGKV